MRSLLAFTVVVTTLAVSVQGNLATELANKEKSLQAVAQGAAAYYQQRCGYLTSSSTACSQPACGSTFRSSDGFDCISGYGDSCDSGCPGMTRSTSKSSVFVPKGTSFSAVDPQAFVASTAGADSLFSTARTTTSGPLNAWQLIGDSTGVTRLYPGAPQARSTSTCTDYDARTRPWYVAAASGPKDVVLLLDVSGSMTDPVGLSGSTREELLRPAVNAILDTLTQNDYVTVITYSGTATVLSPGAPARASASTISSLKATWGNVRFGGSTNVADGFTAAFQQLATGGDYTTGCTKIIMFLTDGKPDAGNQWEAAVTAGQASLTAKGMAKAHIFAVGMGNNAQAAMLQTLACGNDGVYETITDGEDPLVALRGYYQFLAAGLVTNSDSDVAVRWSNPYTDAFGLGEMVTAGVPIFDRSQSTPILTGVAAADVTLAELQGYGADANTVVNTLLTRSQTCPSTNFTQCNLQQLRQNAKSGYICPNQPTPASCEASADAVTRPPCTRSGSNTLNSYFCESIDSSTLLAASSISTTKAQCCTAISGGTDYSGQCSGAGSVFATGVLVLAALTLLLA